MKKNRKYFPETFEILSWDDLEKEYEKLLQFEILSKTGLIEFWERVSELTKILEDRIAWLYVDSTRFADKAECRKAFNDFMSEVVAKSEPYQFKLKKKFYDNPLRKELPSEYEHLNKIIANEIELFREENVALMVKEQELVERYREITSKMTVLFSGKEITTQQLAPYLEKRDEKIRERAWKALFVRYMQDQKELDELFDEMKDIRIRMAKNAGFDNYRDYTHSFKGRFSYNPDDLLQLHSAVEKVVVPFLEELNKKRSDALGKNILKPWDFNVDLEGELPNAFSDHLDLLEKGTRAISSVSSKFGEELSLMQKNSCFDLENRKGKAPGGYCYQLYEKNSSFVFMHAVGIRRDVETFMHEAGHAMHNSMCLKNPIFQYTNNPSEVAELASMSMELLSLEHWDEFYAPKIMESVRKNELIDAIKFLPWGVAVDAFQHWIYTHPEHTPAERGEHFAKLLDRFKIGGDWNGLEKEKMMRWTMQSHIFQWPFYYIEYVIAQLGALGIYQNYRKNSKEALMKYENFLKTGYTKPVAEVYETAGIPFDFSARHISELVKFVREELGK